MYKIDLNNPRTLRLKRDLALKQKDYDLAEACSLRLKMLGYVDNNNTKKPSKRRDYVHPSTINKQRTREKTD